MAGKTAQKPSQYRQALHTCIARPASCSAALAGMGPDVGAGLPPRDAAEHGADRHAEAGQVALAENVLGHDLARGPEIRRRAAVLHEHARALVDAHPEVG